MENLQQLQKSLLEKEQKIRELSLKTDELSDFIENASVPLHWVDNDGRIIWANQAELDFLGYSKQEYIGRLINDFHADVDVINDILTRLKKGETLLNYPARLIRKDGTIKNVIINSNVLVKDGKFIHTRCFTRDISDQFSSHKKVEEAELRTRLAIDAAEMGTFDWDLQNQDFINSQRVIDIFGFNNQKNISHQDLISTFHPDDLFIRNKAVTDAVKNGLLKYEARIIHADQSIHWVKVYGKVIFNNLKEPIRMYGMVTDITEQKNFTAELEQKVLERTDELKQSRAFLQSLLNTTKNLIASYEAIYDKDKTITDFKIVYCNNEVFAYTNIKQEEIIGRTCKEVFPNIFSNGVFEKLVKCVTSGEPDKYEIKSIKNIEPIYFEASIIRLNKNGVTVTATNITEEKNADLKLENLNKQLIFQNELFSHAEESSGQGNYSWNLDTAESTYSDNFFKLLGYNPSEFKTLQEHFKNHIHPDDLEYVMKQIQKILESKEVNEWEFRMITKNGQSFYAKSTGMIITSSGERLLVGTIQDISQEKEASLQLKQMNINLEKQNEELAAFTYIASHDLQEPLRKIMTFSSRLQDKYKVELPDEAKTYLNKIDESAKRMSKLILDLLEYSRLLNEENLFIKTDLNQVAQNVLDDFELVIEQKKAVIHCENMPAIEAIPLHMNQLFHNILSNALKFSKIDETPIINISASKVTKDDVKKYPPLTEQLSYLEIIISDNGIGFEQKYDQQIFVIFQRLNRREQYDGTGIGLAICKKIVDNHYGIIFVDSKLDEGSTFHIILPIHQGGVQ